MQKAAGLLPRRLCNSTPCRASSVHLHWRVPIDHLGQSGAAVAALLIPDDRLTALVVNNGGNASAPALAGRAAIGNDMAGDAEHASPRSCHSRQCASAVSLRLSTGRSSDARKFTAASLRRLWERSPKPTYRPVGTQPQNRVQGAGVRCLVGNQGRCWLHPAFRQPRRLGDGRLTVPAGAPLPVVCMRASWMLAKCRAMAREAERGFPSSTARKITSWSRSQVGR